MSRALFFTTKSLTFDWFQSYKLAPCICGIRSYSKSKHKPRLKQPPKAKSNEAWKERVKAMKGEKVEKPLTAKQLKFLEEFQKRIPYDDVWIQSDFPTRKYTFKEAVVMHREFCSPEMFDNSDGFVKFEANLDFRTKKQTKFLSRVKNVLVLPHHFDDGNSPRVAAICKHEEEKEMALKMGAVHAGGIDLIKSLEKGDIFQYEFDYLLCTTEMLPEITKIRKLVKEKFPNKRDGTTSSDLKAMMEHFMFGKSYESKRLKDNLGQVVVTLGKLDMSVDELRANLDCYLQDLERQKKCLGNFVTNAALLVEPNSGERFVLHQEDIIVKSQSKEKQTKKQGEEDNVENIEEEISSNKELQSEKQKETIIS